MFAEPKSKAEKRRAKIMRKVIDSGSVQVQELVKTLGVSVMTVHRDLAELQEKSLINHVRGTVTAEKSLLFESNYFYRAQQNLKEKKRLAQAAVKHIKPGNAVIWDDSSTTFQVCDYISQVTPLTVVTYSLPVIDRLHDRPDINLIAIGGHYHRGYNGFFGKMSDQTIRSYHVDIALMSTTSVQGFSLFSQDELVVQAKQAMMEVAETSLLLVDSSKFHYSAINHVADMNDFDLVLVSKSLDAEILDQLKNSGVNLEVI